jgi:hypothetical protein
VAKIGVFNTRLTMGVIVITDPNALLTALVGNPGFGRLDPFVKYELMPLLRPGSPGPR